MKVFVVQRLLTFRDGSAVVQPVSAHQDLLSARRKEARSQELTGKTVKQAKIVHPDGSETSLATFLNELGVISWGYCVSETPVESIVERPKPGIVVPPGRKH